MTKGTDRSPEQEARRSGPDRRLTGVTDLEEIDASRHPVTVERREGVFVHVYRCRVCQVKWAVFSWLADPPELRVGAITCPWCHQPTPAVHERTTVSESREFRLDDPTREVIGLVGSLARDAELMEDSQVAPFDTYAGDVADRD